ncbi:MAG: hypothetical protein ACKO5P_08340 [Nodosilinea sp.]
MGHQPIHLVPAIASFLLAIAASNLQPLQASPGAASLGQSAVGSEFSPGDPPDLCNSCFVASWLSQLPPDSLELNPAILNQSPVLQRWLQAIPEVGEEINHQPAFRPRLRATYTGFPARGEVGGFQLGVEDVFLVAGTGLTLSTHYSNNGSGQRRSYGVEARYYLMPLGDYLNLAPTLGYRDLSNSDYSASGIDLGLRLMLIPARGGGADLALSQQWVLPGQPNQVAITNVTLGYAVTSQVRLATDLEFQSSHLGYDNRWGLGLEWLL